MNKFQPTAAWRLRGELMDLLKEIQDLGESAVARLDRREFEYGNLPYCLNQLEKLTKKANKFYKANK